MPHRVRDTGVSSRCIAAHLRLYSTSTPRRNASGSTAMSPTTAAARSTPAMPSLHERLKDPSLLREQCYIEGGWVGRPERPVTNPANGVELAKVPKMGTDEATQA